MTQKKGWIGVDLDGTLAEYHGWVSPDNIGKPIPQMVARVKNLIAEGRKSESSPPARTLWDSSQSTTSSCQATSKNSASTLTIS